MKCRNCGAEVSPTRGKCEYCGGAVESPRTPDPPKAPEPLSREAVFEQICASPQYARRNSAGRHASLPTMSPLKQVFPIVFLIVFICIAGFIAMTALSAGGGPRHTSFGGSPIGAPSGGPPAIFALVPILFVVLGVVFLVIHLGKIGRFNQAETEGKAAIIVSKRTAVSGGGDNSSVSTTYFVTAEFRNGRRREYETLTPRLYGEVAEDDAGVLFVRDSYAVDFDRVLTL